MTHFDEDEAREEEKMKKTNVMPMMKKWMRSMMNTECLIGGKAARMRNIRMKRMSMKTESERQRE